MGTARIIIVVVTRRRRRCRREGLTAGGGVIRVVTDYDLVVVVDETETVGRDGETRKPDRIPLPFQKLSRSSPLQPVQRTPPEEPYIGTLGHTLSHHMVRVYIVKHDVIPILFYFRFSTRRAREIVDAISNRVISLVAPTVY